VAPNWLNGKRHNALRFGVGGTPNWKKYKNDMCSVEVYENTLGGDKMSGVIPL
jgi:hypothetical protein